MEEIVSILKGQPKEVLLYIIYDLMQEGKFSFTDLAELHVKHLEALKKGETERLIKLRYQVSELWSGNKKNIGKKLVALMQQGKDEGYYNLTQEQIDNSKWNKN